MKMVKIPHHNLLVRRVRLSDVALWVQQEALLCDLDLAPGPRDLDYRVPHLARPCVHDGLDGRGSRNLEQK